MRKIFEVLIMSVCVIYLLNSCNGCGSQKTGPDKQEQPETSLAELVEIWNKANNNKDISVLRSMYDTVVHFYQHKYTVDECMKRKIEYFEKYPDFKQIIEGKIFVDSLKDGFVRINFTKAITRGDEEEEVAAYLVFSKRSEGWKIYAESDLPTDRLLSSGAAIPSNAVEGDFNGDGITDYMWLETNSKTEECKIRFSGAIPPLIVGTCLGGSPVNESDLNDDGTDEVGILPIWESSCWKGYFVYTFNDNQWDEAIEPVSTHCIQWEKNILPVIKDSTRKGYVLVNYSELTDDGIEIKTKSVRIR
jgi:ketosteroid isomerase-like protein